MRTILRLATVLAGASMAFAAGLAQAVYSITLVDYPGSVYTDIRGINNSGRIAGYASFDNVTSFGFTYLGGAFTTFPALPGGISTYAHGINDAGVVAGGTSGEATGDRGLTLNGGTYTFFQKPGWLNTNVRFISNSGLVVGYADDGTLGPAGFIYNPATSTFVDIVVPGSNLTIPQGMNTAGQLVGSAHVPGIGTEGFLRQPGGAMSFFQLDGQVTRARGINDLGVMTGNLNDTLGNFHAWVGTSLGYELIDIPGAMGTVGQSINNAGQVSGFYYDGVGNSHGFIATPAVLPTGTTSGGAYTFGVDVVPNVPIFIDPAVAVAYDYKLGKKDPMFASVRLPIGVGDSMYMLVVDGKSFAIGGGTLFDFRANGFRKGVKSFRVACIEPSANLDPANPLAFVTELTFTDAGRFTGTQKPLTDHPKGKTRCEKASKGEADDDDGEGDD
jgi:uncharacterized membrane protein